MLLTRSPLYSSPCGDFLVRLACVRHAASVDSEPGSNSRLKLGSPANFASASACERLTCETIVPPLVLNWEEQELPVGQNVSLSIRTQSLKDSVRLTWHAQLNCQRALSPAEGGVPKWGRIGKLTPEASLVCLAGLPRTYSVGGLPCRAVNNSTRPQGDCQGHSKKNLE